MHVVGGLKTLALCEASHSIASAQKVACASCITGASGHIEKFIEFGLVKTQFTRMTCDNGQSFL